VNHPGKIQGVWVRYRLVNGYWVTELSGAGDCGQMLPDTDGWCMGIWIFWFWVKRTAPDTHGRGRTSAWSTSHNTEMRWVLSSYLQKVAESDSFIEINHRQLCGLFNTVSEEVKRKTKPEMETEKIN